MATKAELQSLLEMVESAEGGSRVIDFWLSIRFGEGTRHTDEELQADIDTVGIDEMVVDAPFSSSIDAALALVERVLPGKHFRLGIGYVGDYSSADLGKAGRLSRWSCDGFAERPDNELPLAILAALLRALIAQGDKS